MIAKTIKGTTAGDIQLALTESLADGYKPTLAIVFISVKQDSESVCRILHDAGMQILDLLRRANLSAPKFPKAVL